MTLTKQQVREVLDVYIQAWTEQDPELITTIFTPRRRLPRARPGDADPGPRRHPRLLADQRRRRSEQNQM